MLVESKLSKLMASKFVNQIYRLLDHQRIKKKLRFNPFFLGIFPLAWPHTSSTIRSFDFEAPFEVSTFLKWNTFFSLPELREKNGQTDPIKCPCIHPSYGICIFSMICTMHNWGKYLFKTYLNLYRPMMSRNIS